mmetsp:Transcript_182/g.404  ORF Transcript_182/g.404 Transcript_182/m.404 type:complete len:115 (-) Transcript_182:71-415(-)
MGRSLSLVLLAICATLTAAFVPGAALVHASTPRSAVHSPVMMGKQAKDGPFTPLVIAGKVVLGEKLLNKVRGKAISYHSQFISEFCYDYGVPNKMRGALIKKAKTTGDTLGFLS